jgi:hypothetical protein
VSRSLHRRATTAIALCVAVIALVPAAAQARPPIDSRVDAAATAGKLGLGTTLLSGGAIGLFVFGTIALAIVGDRRYRSSIH